MHKEDNFIFDKHVFICHVLAMINIIEFFDRANIINLRIREDRRNETREEFSRFNLPIDTDKIGFIEAYSPKDRAGFPTAGTHGCFLSHLSILKNAHRDGLRNILVLEDDITFSKDILNVSEQAISELKNLDWDFVYFSHSFDEPETPLGWRMLNKDMLCTHFYAVNGKCLDDLIVFLETLLKRPEGHPDGGPMHYDGAINVFRNQNPGKNIYYFSKNLGFQRPSKTNIHETGFLDNTPIIRHIVPYLRKIKGVLLRQVR